MTASESRSSEFNRTSELALPLIPGCSITKSDLVLQRRRLARLSRDVVHLHRTTHRLEVDFGPDFARQDLDDAVAVERRCCPFFIFAFDESANRLRVSVQQPAFAPALDALAEQLTTTTASKLGRCGWASSSAILGRALNVLRQVALGSLCGKRKSRRGMT